jgi:hypothetical protein
MLGRAGLHCEAVRRQRVGSRSWRSGLLAVSVGVALSMASAHVLAEPGASITIYRVGGSMPAYGLYGGVGYGGYAMAGQSGSGYAVIAERRALDLVKGDNQVSFVGVAAGIDPSTVQFHSVTDPDGTSVVEQSFAYDLASPEALLARYRGHRITAVTSDGEVSGTLLAHDGGRLVLDTGDSKLPVRIVERSGLRDIRFSALDGGLVTEPTLRWRIRAGRAGRHQADVSYRASGLAWSADYAAVLDGASNKVDLSGWVTVSNQSGTDFSDAKLTLVSSSAPATPQVYTGYIGASPSSSAPEVYPLDRPATLPSGATVQLELFAPTAGARSRELIVYEPLANTAFYASGYPNSDCYAYQYQPVRSSSDRVLEVTPGRRHALPDGRLRVFRRAADGTLGMIGEDQVVPDEHGALRVRVGTTEDIKGERRQLECRPDQSGRALAEKIEVKVSNASKKAAHVVVREYMQRWSNWTVSGESVKSRRSGQVAEEYALDIPAGGSKTVTYTVNYVW